jgi:cytochrome c-type biogenesis protein
MSDVYVPTLFAAIFAGLLSFFSPCVLPLIPSYILYIAGITLKDVEAGEDAGKIGKLTVVNSLFFILGFFFVFVSLGVAISFVGQLLFDFREIIRVAGGLIVISMGLFIMGVFKIPYLDIERRIHVKSKPAGYVGSFLLGVTFSIAWTPCVGPILGSILLLAGTSSTVLQGFFLLLFYSLGFALPFFLASLSVNSAIGYFKKISRYFGVIKIVSGVFLIFIGILILLDSLQTISAFLLRVL